MNFLFLSPLEAISRTQKYSHLMCECVTALKITGGAVFCLNIYIPLTHGDTGIETIQRREQNQQSKEARTIQSNEVE